jgi:hypothetical protein
MKPEKYKNKYRIKSTRAAWWNYGSPAAYFVTINTADRKHFFGKICNGKMVLAPAGIIADLCWQSLHARFSDWVIDEYVIMPDNVHVTFIKKYPGQKTQVPDKKAPSLQLAPTQALRNAEEGHHQRFRNPGKSTLSSVVGSFKSSVTRNARRLGYDFGWQPRFHDIIAKDEHALKNFRNYMAQNVAEGAKSHPSTP